jgi:hypothetical protein
MVGCLLLTAAETRQGKHFGHASGFCASAALWRRAGGKLDESNSDAPAPSKVDAMGEGQFLAEPATRFERNAEFDLAVGEDGFQLRIAF